MALPQPEETYPADWKRTLYIMFLAELVAAVGFSSNLPFLPLYVKSLGAATHLSIELLAGLAFSGQAFTMAIASPIWGELADRHGRKLMVERAMFGGAAILLLMAFVQSAEQLVLLRALQGFITGMVGAANALVAATTPRRQTGYAMGLLQVGLGSGFALGPLIGGAVADAAGYATVFYVTSALLLIAGLLVWQGVDEHFEPVELAGDQTFSLMAKWRHILTAPGVTMTYGLRFVSQLGRMMLVPIAPLFIQTLLPDTARLNTFTGLVVGVASATTTISAVYLGRLGDRIGHRRILITGAILAALLYFPQSLVTSGWQLLVFQALVGIAIGGIVPATSALLSRYTQMGEEGAVYGLDNSIAAGSRAVAPLFGASVAMGFGLRATFVATALTYLITGILASVGLPKPETPRRLIQRH
jgi:DHA1 family multidrug resistance protein-like MFS transporter